MESTGQHYPSILDDVTSSRTKLVSLTVAVTSPDNVSQPQQLLSIVLRTLPSVVRTLSERNLVHRTTETDHRT